MDSDFVYDLGGLKKSQVRQEVARAEPIFEKARNKRIGRGMIEQHVI